MSKYKKLIFLIVTIVAVLFIFGFSLIAEELTSKHTDVHLLIPFICTCAGALLACLMICIRFVTVKFNISYFYIPLVIIISGIIAFQIATSTPCCMGG